LHPEMLSDYLFYYGDTLRFIPGRDDSQ